MKLKILYVLMILLSSFMLVGCNSKGKSSEVLEKVKVLINKEEYEVTLEDNKTAEEFVSLIPVLYNMKELNGNEKYVYLDTSLSTNSYNPKRINAGDIMLFNDNCLVIFYKSFDTSYSYTKIGHINNLSNLDDKDVEVQFIK